MGKIVQLDEALSNKIAAGEVVERPASVIKELLENAIDANSTVVEIEVIEAGLESMRIVDNGEGMLPEDVEKAFHRHATSKIKDEHDLFRIRTLGFRGEAMPSIASVSHVELKTSTGDGAGTCIVLDGGVVKELEAASSRKGTDITVSNLFYNTPARLKYLKTIHTELGKITDVVNRLALAHPEVSIRLSHNGKKMLHTNGNGDVLQVLAAIYGINMAKKMIPLAATTLDYNVSGYIMLPEMTRASRNYMSTMINGRFIKNYGLVKAIVDGYHTLLPIGRFPIALLSIEMDPILVDVNVHPSKLEVRLSKEQELYTLVTESVKDVFKKHSLIPTVVPHAKQQPKSEQTMLQLDHVVEKVDEEKPKPALMKDLLVRNERPRIESVSTTDKHKNWQEVREDLFDMSVTPSFERVEEQPCVALDEQLKETALRIPPLYPIGQMHGTYIFAQNEQGLYMIDQHAAQERIKYEYFKEKVGRVANELQEMLVPITLEFSNDQLIRIYQYKQELEQVGVFLEEFGQHAFIVRAHPQWFPKGMEQEILEEMIEQLLNMKKVDIKQLREEAAILMSCKASIKANRHLRNDEIQALLDELRQTTDPFTCPHGRPIIIHYSIYEMEKMFKRVM